MLSISLKNIHLHGKHGLYESEAITGNEFEVDVTVRLPLSAADEWPFVDYTGLYKIVEEVFSTPTRLLETLVRAIYNRVKEYAPEGAILKVAVRKMNPPIAGADIECSEVCLSDDD